jgi:hypothetical protein
MLRLNFKIKQEGGICGHPAFLRDLNQEKERLPSPERRPLLLQRIQKIPPESNRARRLNKLLQLPEDRFFAEAGILRTKLFGKLLQINV